MNKNRSGKAELAHVLISVGVFAVLVFGIQTASGLTISSGGITMKSAATSQRLAPGIAFLCNFENSTSCKTQAGNVAPLKTTYTLTSQGGTNNSGAAIIPQQGAVGMYSGTNFNPTKGRIDAWIAPAVGSTKKQYIFSTAGTASLNGDALNDLIVGETGTSGNETTSHVYFGGAGSMDTNNPASFISHAPRGIAVGDINNNGIADMVVAMNGANEVWIFSDGVSPGQSLNTPPPSQRLTVAHPQGNTLADLDNDGDLDLIVASYDLTTPPFYVFMNDGNGNFTDANLNFGGFTAPGEGTSVGDANHDGVLDILFGSFSADAFKPSILFFGASAGPGSYSIDLANPNRYAALDNAILGVAMADVNNDGWIDAILADTLQDQIIVRLNELGLFPDDAAHKLVLPTTRPFTVATGDFNNDGHLDIATANWKKGVDTPTSTVFLGPSFTSQLSYPVDNAVSLTVGDLDADGISDVFFHSSSANTSPVYYLNIDGSVKNMMSLTTEPTTQNPLGPGAGTYASIKGTTAYGTSLDASNSFEFYFDPQDSKLHFVITDKKNVRHEATLPFTPTATVQHVQVTWDVNVGNMTVLAGVAPNETSSTVSGTPIPLGTVSPIFNLGTDWKNQYSLNGTLDTFQIAKP